MLEIHITTKDYLELIDKLDDRHGWDAGGLVHDALLNRMTIKSRKEYIRASVKRLLNELDKKNE